MARIRVTHTHADGYVNTWTQDGDTEQNRKRRFRNAGIGFRGGPGWVEVDRDRGDEQLGPYTERIDWLDHPANAA